MSITENYKLNLIQWYPGHIAKAERQLKEQAKHLENVERLKWVLDSEHLKSRGKSISISTLKQLNVTIFSQKCKLLVK